MKHTAERTSANGGPFGDAGSPEERVPSSRPGKNDLVVDWTDETSSERADMFVDWTDDDDDARPDEPSCIDWTETEASGVRPRLELPWQPASDSGGSSPHAGAAPASARTTWTSPQPVAPEPGVLRADPRTPIPPGWPVASRDEEPESRPTWPTGVPVPPRATEPGIGATELPPEAPRTLPGFQPPPPERVALRTQQPELDPVRSAARPLATHVPEEIEAAEELPFDLFGHPPPEEEPVTWPVDPEVERLWNARRGRRAAVRALGWALVALSIAGLGHLAMTSGAGAEMAYFATMGQVDDGSQAGRVARANVLEDRIRHVPDE